MKRKSRCERKLGNDVMLAFVCATLAAPVAFAGGADGDRQIEEIIVTASKRAESVRDVASTVNVVTGATLDKLNASSFQDFATFVPSMSSFSAGAGQNQIILRGVSTGGQSSSTVAVYLDETPIGSSTSFAFGSNALDSSLFDLQRLEVLSGPQGTLYGASTLGGLVKYVTHAPDLNDFQATLEGDLSHTDNGRLNHAERGVINLPVLQDRLAVRVVGFAQDDAGYIENATRDLERIDDTEIRGGRISLLGQITPQLSLRLSAMTQRIDRGGKTNVDRNAQTGAHVRGPYDQSSFTDEPYVQSFLMHSGLLSWNLGWADLTANSAWQKIGSQETIDTTKIFGPLLGTGTAFPYTTFNEGQTRKFTQEIRLTSNAGERLDWQFGAFYTLERAEGTTILSNLASPDGTLGGLPLYRGAVPTKYRELAGFGDITVHLTSKADVILGLRYSKNEQDYTQRNQGLFSSPTNPLAVVQRSVESSEHVVTYLVNPRYHLTDDSMLYARFATGYRPGGPNLVAFDAVGNPLGSPTFDADEVYTYELGEKSMFLEGRATLDFSVYFIDWRDIQLTGVYGGLAQLENGGKARVMGAEMVGSYDIRSLTLGGSLAYTDGKLQEDAPALGAKEGQRLPLSARFSAALTADYKITLTDGLMGNLGLSSRFVGERAGGFPGSVSQPQYLLDSYQLFDLRAGLVTPRFSANLFAKNLFNKLGEVSADLSAIASNPNSPARVTVVQPRTIGLEFKANFER